MKTSVPLFNEFGDPIHNFYLAFVADCSPIEAGKQRNIAGFLVAEDSMHLLSTNFVDQFLQHIDKPFEICNQDLVYLNSECYYGDEFLAAIRQKIEKEGDVDFSFVATLPDQLDGFGLGLSGAQRRAFQFGYPVWRRGARSSAGGRGNKGCFSREALALRDAMQAWTVIGEQIIRHAFRRAQKEKLAFIERHKDVSASAKKLIKLSLGYHSGSDKDYMFDVIVDCDGHYVLSLERFKHQTVFDEARELRFLRPESPKINYFCPQDETQSPRYVEMPGTISKTLSFEIETFSDRHPDCRFDALALAQWTSRILINLRIAYSAVLAVDRKRSSMREALRIANTDFERNNICIDFSCKPLTALKGFLKSESGGMTQVSTDFSLNELFGLQEAVVIALLADIEPRVIHVNPTELPVSYINALLETARWLGQLYRSRYGVMNVPQATRLDWITTSRDLEPEAAAALRVGVATMMSFLTPEGQNCIWKVAAAVIDDGSARSIFLVDTRPRAATTGIDSPLADLAEKNGWSATASLPDPILVPGGYLLVPGDFVQEWQGKCADLMASLVVPTERD